VLLLAAPDYRTTKTGNATAVTAAGWKSTDLFTRRKKRCLTLSIEPTTMHTPEPAIWQLTGHAQPATIAEAACVCALACELHNG
jgi:hypothetical protein